MKLKINILTVLLVLCFPALHGQYKLNFGLTQPQDSSALPKSSAKIPEPVRKAKVPANTVLQPVASGNWLLTGGWELAPASVVIAGDKSIFSNELNTSAWYNAIVPGTVLTTLVNQGVFPDPYYGLNNLTIPDTLCRTDWWYRISFRMPAGVENKISWLLFDGINYRAEVWFNGKRLGKINGAFQRGKFAISDVCKFNDNNILAVHILPPPNPGIPHEESPRAGQGPNGGQLCLDGPTFISSEGWDWVPGIRDRNIGIWQNVHLLLTGNVTIDDPQVITDLPLPDTTNADVTVKTELTNYSARPQKVTLTGKLENITFSRQITLAPHQKAVCQFSPGEFSQLKLKNPRLWWPNGYGKPDLYKLQLSVTQEDNTLSDTKEVSFGVRELSYDLTVDLPGREGARVEFNPMSALQSGKPLFDNVNRRNVGDGVEVPKLREGVNPNLLAAVENTKMAPYLVIKVNGKPVFCRGGNWGMDDAMKNTSREHLEPYFRLHRDANFTMIRNWTGESTEEVFYQLADEYGLLVWNDFWLSTEGYNLNVNDNPLFLANAQETIRRFRNHPCIAVWCPRNEGYAPAGIEDELATLIAKEDGTRHYQPNSRYMNLRPSGPWHYFTDAAEYFKSNARGFNTELGTPSVPTADAMKLFLPKEDQWPISDAWYYHDLHYGEKDYCKAIETLYGAPANLDDFCKKAQMVNYDSHRAMFESWNSKLWDNTSGILLWMTHPAWPSTVWQVYSWNYQTSGSYFASKKACETLHVQMNLHDNKVVVLNNTLHPLNGATVSLVCYDLQGKQLYKKEQLLSIMANQLNYAFTPEWPATLPAVYLVRVMLKDSRGSLISKNDYWKTSGENKTFTAFNQLPAAVLKGRIISTQPGKLVIEVTNTSKVPALAIKLDVVDNSSGEIKLPAYFSDGYFNLMPGEKQQISVEGNIKGHFSVVANGYNGRGATLIKLDK